MQVKDEEQEAAKFDAVFPCILRIIPQMVFNKKDPIIVGVDVEEGIAKVQDQSLKCLQGLQMFCSTAEAVCRVKQEAAMHPD